MRLRTWDQSPTLFPAEHDVDIRIRIVGQDLSWTFGPIEYRPASETEDEFKAQAREQFESSMTEYITKVRHAYEQRGWQPAEMVELREMDHIKWLVLYQVQGQSINRIADEHRHDRKSVGQAIKRFASLIGLPVRTPTKGGRPRMAPKREV